jgi:hypothetical protein
MQDDVKQPRRRSTLPREEARRRYVEMGELVVLEQLRRDALRLDEESISVGPFARLDANAVAALDGKTRGAVTNVFGSQAAFRAETMALALSAEDWLGRIEYPDPADFESADDWVDAFFTGEAARGPVHDGDPEVRYASLWALWLSAVPYGLWSERVSRPSIDEQLQHVERLEAVLRGALDHFGVEVRAGTTVRDLASAIASLVEGVWLNQCLTRHHPSEPAEPIATLLRRSGRLLWLGATVPR